MDYYDISCHEQLQMECSELIKTRLEKKYVSISKHVTDAYWGGAKRIYDEGKNLLDEFKVAQYKIQTRPISFNGGTGYLYEDLETTKKFVNEYEHKFNAFIKEWNVIV